MLWYVLERYVHCLLGRTHLDLPNDEKNKAVQDEGGGTHHNGDKMLNGSKDGVKEETEVKREHIHLTPHELHGLKAIVMYLHSLPTNKKNVPELIKDPIALIKDVRTLVEQHRYDNPELAVTGKPILKPPEEDERVRIYIDIIFCIYGYLQCAN